MPAGWQACRNSPLRLPPITGCFLVQELRSTYAGELTSSGTKKGPLPG
jgi:hypothetical protein